MIINVANLTLRFQIREGWTVEKISELLIDPTMEIVFRECGWEGCRLDYFAVYENSGYGVFKKDILEHEFHNPFNNSIEWYIGEE